MMLAVKNGAQAKLHKVENRLAEEKASRIRDMVNREIETEFKVGAQIQNRESVVIEYNFNRKVKAYDFESGSEAEDKVNTADLMEISGEVQFFRAGVRVVGVHKNRGGYQFLIMGVQM